MKYLYCDVKIFSSFYKNPRKKFRFYGKKIGESIENKFWRELIPFQTHRSKVNPGLVNVSNIFDSGGSHERQQKI